LVTKPKAQDQGGIDEAIADILPFSPPPATSNPEILLAVPAVSTAKTSKAKPRRSRAKTDKGKMAAAQASAQSTPSTSTYTFTPKATTAPGPNRLRKVPLPLPSSSSFYDRGMGELNNDEDLAMVLPRLFGRQTFWEGSDDDEPALDLVREVRRRDQRSPPSGMLEDEYDSLDEMMPPMGPVRVMGETEHPDGQEVVVPVMSRSRNQARFMMAKAKVMLLAEENEMRRKELEATMNEEIDLDRQITKRNRFPTNKM